MSNRNRFTSSTSSNPFLNVEHMQSTQSQILHNEERNVFNRNDIYATEGSMTVQGAVNKTLILTGLLLITAVIAWQMATPALMWIGVIGGLIAALVAYMKPNTANITAPLYAIFEGLALGTISLMVAASFGEGFFGIVTNAIFLTIFALLAMLGAYKTGLIKPTEKFKSIIFTATGAIAVLYLVSMLLGLFGINIPYLHEGGVIGIGISLVIVGIAALNLIIDFESFEVGEKMGESKKTEWLCALGLLVTLVWLYMEILRLLSKINRD